MKYFIFLIIPSIWATVIESHLDFFRVIASKSEQLRDIGYADPPVAISSQELLDFRKLTRLMYTSYCDGNLENWSCGVCRDKGSPIKNTSHIDVFQRQGSFGGMAAVGLVGVSHDLSRVFIAFQGARHLPEWFRCFDALLVRATEIGVPSHIRVHQGFYKVYKSIRAEITDLVYAKINQFPSYKIAILGHSYGGALGSIFALDISQGYLKNLFNARNVELITFGQPRVGNRFYSYAINNAGFSNVYRFVHSTDIFSHLVPRIPWIGIHDFYD